MPRTDNEIERKSSKKKLTSLQTEAERKDEEKERKRGKKPRRGSRFLSPLLLFLHLLSHPLFFLGKVFCLVDNSL